MTNEPLTILGENHYRGTARRFGIKQRDRLGHMWILGKTGTGKSTLLKNLIHADLLAGHGCMVIDPHGDLVEEILDLVPESRIPDTIYFNPADTAYPIGYNPLDALDTLSPPLQTAGLLSIFKKTWPEFWGPRMEYLLRSSLLSLLSTPKTTLLDLHRLLVDAEFRKQIIANVTDPQLTQFWQKEFAGYTPGFRTDSLSPIINKTGQYLTNPVLRNIIGQRTSSFSLRHVIDQGGIFLANLSRGRLGEDTSMLLGSLLVTQVELAAISRADRAESTRRNFFLYMDEAHLITTRAMVDLFPEARKFHLGIILAHQYLDQLDEAIRYAVMGNVGSMISFRLGARDAAVLAQEFGPLFEKDDFLSLPAYNAYLKIMVDGVSTKPFSCVTFPPPGGITSYRDAIIASTRSRYSRPVAEVEAEIRKDWVERAEDNQKDGE